MTCLDSTVRNTTFVVSISIEWVLLTIHSTVLVCILRQRAKGAAVFRSGFFTVYVIQSVADIVHYPLELMVLRLPPMGCVPADLDLFPLMNIISFLLTYAANIQFTSHAVIGVNRFYVLTDGWTDRKQHIAIIAILCLSLPTAALRTIGHSRLVETPIPGVYTIVRDVPWAQPAATYATLLYEIATAIVTVVFELLSLARYKRLTAAAKAKYHNDFLLLVYALLQFAIQLAACVSYGLFAIGGMIGDFQFLSVVKAAMNPISVAFCLSPSICLLSTSKILRKAYFRMYNPLAREIEASSRVFLMKPISGGNGARAIPGAKRTL